VQIKIRPVGLICDSRLIYFLRGAHPPKNVSPFLAGFAGFILKSVRHVRRFIVVLNARPRFKCETNFDNKQNL
jgi:hypothetical protein